MFAYIQFINPTDPGFGGGLPAYGGGQPDNSLPWGPGHPSNALPFPPGHPGNGLPRPPVFPGNDLPQPPPDASNKPIVLPPPPVVGVPVFPGLGLPEIPPGTIWPPLPPYLPGGKVIVLVAISGVGWRWAVLDTSLSAGTPLPPAAQPK
jgi:hypothetical protein